ncbi:MAG TPA: hypothetical protein VFF24_09290, partial [Acidimicrobiia bacterium]|nr:hypothetical protein [Acidimicrobiia bacterium]
MIELPPARSVTENPSAEELRQWALELMPRVTVTEFDNVNYQSEVTSRLNPSTFFVSDVDIAKNHISRDEAAEWARRQDEYLADRDVVVIEGYIGPDPDFRTGCRLVI